ncbi:MAG: YajQ family cyclic di-GMP-binding protein [Nitrospinota bacterium]|nr:YajQ family cyclic di-GMP-binding protein [Nitrospinota bacterium]
MASFDIVSQIDLNEVDNAINGIGREIKQRYDLKGSKCAVERKERTVLINADDDFKLKQVIELIATYFQRRKIDARMLQYNKVENASGGAIRQEAVIRDGIDQETARHIVKEVKGTKTKVQIAIQGNELRVSGKKRDDLQNIITFCKEIKGVEQPLQFINFRD